MSTQVSTASFTYEDIFERRTLYDPIVLDKNTDRTRMQALLNGTFQYDTYCIQCARNMTFKGKRTSYRYTADEAFDNRDIYVQVQCARIDAHEYVFLFRSRDAVLTKIGQYPSVEDITAHDLQKFRPILPKQYYEELHRASGLFAHGIGIGAFVYLRRIFERLVEDHRSSFEAKNGPIPDYAKKRMDEKIQSLSAVLPTALVQHKIIYGVLSKGIHELSEKECRTYFPAIKAAVLAILEQDLQNREKENSEKALGQELARISETLSKPPPA